MIKLSEVYRGDELREKLDILHKVYSFLKKDQAEGAQNFFDNFAKKYTMGAADRGSYTKREEWEEAHQREKVIADVERFAQESEMLCRQHAGYLRSLVQADDLGRPGFAPRREIDESLESEEPSDAT
jgi:outer membrane protein assembly factor BamD (BamD/ComL family)